LARSLSTNTVCHQGLCCRQDRNQPTKKTFGLLQYDIPLQDAAGHPPDLDTEMLAKGANVNAANRKREMLVFQAADVGEIERVRMLLSAGADVDASTRSGVTPLHAAAAAGHAQVVQLLLTAGANVNAAATSDTTSLYAAAASGYAQVVQLLLAAGANTGAAAKLGKHPLSHGVVWWATRTLWPFHIMMPCTAPGALPNVCAYCDCAGLFFGNTPSLQVDGCTPCKWQYAHPNCWAQSALKYVPCFVAAVIDVE
jgi:hypothetical protein